MSARFSTPFEVGRSRCSACQPRSGARHPARAHPLGTSIHERHEIGRLPWDASLSWSKCAVVKEQMMIVQSYDFAVLAQRTHAVIQETRQRSLQRVLMLNGEQRRGRAQWYRWKRQHTYKREVTGRASNQTARHVTKGHRVEQARALAHQQLCIIRTDCR